MRRIAEESGRFTRVTFNVWLDDALTCGIRGVEMFARRRELDGAALCAALTTASSNGQTVDQARSELFTSFSPREDEMKWPFTSTPRFCS